MTNDKDLESRTVDEVQDEIGHTRAELDETLDEIGRRLSPAELRHQVKVYLGDTIAQAADAARRNPASITAGALMVAGTVLVRHRQRAWARQVQAEQMRTIWDRLVQSMADARDEHLGGRSLSDVVAKATDLAQRARESVAETVGDVAAKAQYAWRNESLADLAKPAQRMLTSVEASSREHALLSLVIAAGAGAMISSLCRK
jgi:hypothetical protein